MKEVYPAVYLDAQGECVTTIENHFIEQGGFRMELFGVQFEGNDFNDFWPLDGTKPTLLSRFRLSRGSLCEYSLKFEMPVTVWNGEGMMPATLHVHLAVGVPHPTLGTEVEAFHITLTCGDLRLEGSGKSGWFENELLEIQRQLPAGWCLAMCIGCSWSDYSVYGHRHFGDMICFRHRKTEYRAVKTKADYMNMGEAGEKVQETWRCPEFERRPAGIGYRG